MHDNLKQSAKHPLFKLSLASAIKSISEGARLLILLGIDVEHETTNLLKKVEEILRDATYDSINLDELLSQAQAMGDTNGNEENEESSETFGPPKDTY